MGDTMKKSDFNIFLNLKSSMFARIFFIFFFFFIFSTSFITILWVKNTSKTSESLSTSHIFDTIQSSNLKFEEQLSTINSLADSVLTLYNTSYLKNKDKSSITAALTNYYYTFSKEILGISVLDTYGNKFTGGTTYISADYLTASWFNSILNSADPSDKKLSFIQRELYGSKSKTYMTAAKLIISNNEPIGAILVDLNPQIFIKAFGMSRMEGKLRTIIINEKKNILYCSDSFFSEITQREIVEKGLSLSYPDKLTDILINDTKYMMMSQKSSYLGWTNITFFPSEVISNSYKNTTIMTISYSLLFLIITTLLTGLFFFLTTRRMSKLTSSILNIDIRNIDDCIQSFDTDKNDEIGLISSTIFKMLQKIASQMNNIMILNEEKHKSDLKSLKSQLNLHFLYNTLQVIVNLSKIQGINNIREVSESLIHLLHYSIDQSSEFVKISEEIEYIKKYILLMKYKFFGDINIIYDIEDELSECYCMRMLLQPVVENSIKYAFTGKPNEYLIIKIRRIDSDIEINIVDNGKGIPKEKVKNILTPKYSKEGHIGLSNLNKRIKLSFGEDYGLKIHSVESIQTTVIIKVPYIDSLE